MSGAPDAMEMTAALAVLRPIDVPIEDVISFRGTLGRGSFGLVKLGRLRSSKKKVAVKVIKKSSVTSRRQLHQLCREVQTLSSLRHEAIISFYGVVDNRENLYLLLEYAAGGELFDFIVKQGRLSEGVAARCFRDMVRSVRYIHARSIVHRDIKPENFLLTRSGRVKLSDFGFCNTQQDGRFIVTPCGSPTYAAPEIYRNQPYDLTVDTWSLGVCLCVCFGVVFYGFSFV
jgi:serine/threonine protein kinase